MVQVIFGATAAAALLWLMPRDRVARIEALMLMALTTGAGLGLVVAIRWLTAVVHL